MPVRRMRPARIPWPEGGVCQGHSQPQWWGEEAGSAERQAAQLMCQTCPVLARCRDYAGQYRWRDVTIAGWDAPAGKTVVDAKPPWAVVGVVTGPAA